MGNSKLRRNEEDLLLIKSINLIPSKSIYYRKTIRSGLLVNVINNYRVEGISHE